MPDGITRRRHLLTTALVGALLPTDPPEGHKVRAWLDSWAGAGHVVDAMHSAGYNVRHFQSPFVWWVEFCRDEVTPIAKRTTTRCHGGPSSAPYSRRCGRTA